MNIVARLGCAVIALAGVFSPTCDAHEFWVLPASFRLAAPATVDLSLTVGQNFTGYVAGFGKALVTRLDDYSSSGRRSLASSIPDVLAAAARVRVDRPGTHLIALDTLPNSIVLPADKFTEYLKLEGLEQIIESRERSGTSAAEGRERYRRNIKTIVLVGARSDASFSARTGQRLELVPRDDPFRLKPGDAISLVLYFDEKPLAGALVKLWHRSGEPAAVMRRTDDSGAVRLAVDAAGTWMASVVHMVPCTDSPEFDWDSYWGNLTFEVGPAR
jgi:uncharacterized GH25 family protein